MNSSASSYGLMSGSPASAMKRGKANFLNHRQEEPQGFHSMFEELEHDIKIITRRTFEELRKDTLDESSSQEEGSAEEEPSQLSPAGMPVGRVDELTLLLSDAPLKKLRVRQRQAQKQWKAGDQWGALRSCQEAVALAEMYSPSGPYRDEVAPPMLVADAHLALARAYGEVHCIPQAHEHCTKAIEAVPVTHNQKLAFKQDVGVLLGEMMMVLSPPKPQAALQHFYTAAQVQSSEEVKDVGIKLLVAQCHAQWGIAKLHEADATKGAHAALQQRANTVKAKLKEVNAKSPEHEQLLQTLTDTQNELREEKVFEAVLVNEAHQQLNESMNLLMPVIDEEETRLRTRPDCSDPDKIHPMITVLWGLICEIGFWLATVDGRLGNVRDQLRGLAEVRTAQQQYDCMAPGLFACALEQQASALVVRASSAQDGSGEADLQQALQVYEQLLEVQEGRFSEDEAKAAITRAEVLKQIGDVYIIMQDWDGAQVHFQEAKAVFESYLGPDSDIVRELEEKIQE